jgi:hypothetical protein
MNSKLKKILVVIAGLILIAIAIVIGTSNNASANRPVPGYHYKDVCKNIKGKQTILDVTGISARYKFDETTKRRHDCVAVNHIKG